MKRARILRNNIQFPPQRTERASVDTMAMRRTQHVGPGLVNRAVNHKRRRIQQPPLTAPDNLSRMIDLDEVAAFHERERETEGVDPEGVRVDRIADGDVPRDAFVEAVFGEDS